MRYVPEAVSAGLISLDLAIEATGAAFIAAADPANRSFPSVLGHGFDPSNRFSIKSATTPALTGLKVGSYWPGNDLRGLARHSSSILLFDTAIGRIEAVVEASAANAYRTAAANALAVRRLARADARRLAIFGAGRQAWHECQAVARERKLDRIFVVNRDASRATTFVTRLAEAGWRVDAVSAEEACRGADIIVTATAARAPLFDAAWVRPGTHISCMGADAVGKQELPIDLLSGATLFCDLAEQSLTIGEFQHVAEGIARGAVPPPVLLGDVLTGRHAGRPNDQAVTVFDSSGIALQDLHLADLLLRRAAEEGRMIELQSQP